MLRERQFVAVLRERATREASLRAAAEALAAAYTLDDIAHQIARSAVSVLPAHGAFVLDITDTPIGTRALVVRSTAGSEVPPIGTTCALAGSSAERAFTSAGPVIASVNCTDPLMRDVIMIGSTVSALIVRLHDGDVPRGALFVLSSSGFDADDVIWARTLEHVATLAYEKVRLLDAANDGRRKLETVMHSRSRLMRGFSHDVKNPLGAADGFTALMLEGVYGELTTSQQESLQRVRRSINVALGLIDDLNDFARAEAGKVTLAIAPVDVAELARTSGAQYHASANAKGLTLHVDIAPGLPPVATDAARLRQVVSNLLSNAIKYTDNGVVELRVAQSADPANHVTSGVRIDVTDTGPGIPAAKQALIFDEFSRLHATKQPGAGLGLPISKLLAEMLGGSISVDSNEGVGSTFTLWIPAEAPGFSETHHALRVAAYE
jgi:signal transduction histidine kinase